MSRRVQRLPAGVPDDGPEVGSGKMDDVTIETTFDGQTFAWGPGQIRNFIDNGVGVGHQNADQVPQGGLGTAGLVSIYAGAGLYSPDGNIDH